MSPAIDGTAVSQVLEQAVASGAVPHVAAIAADRDGVIYQGAAGPRAVGESDPASVDTMFRIMSMTKMPATVAALQQVEQGNLDLAAPVAEYCPEFAGVQVLTGFAGGQPQYRPPATQATVQQLLTHTSGLGYWFWNSELVEWEKSTGIPNVVAGVRSSLTAPLLADPGTAFIYGINIDWLGQVIEAVTGLTLDVAIKQGITGPLGMDHTTFLMNDDQRLNCSPVHVRDENGSWLSVGEVLSQAPEYFAGGHGLYGPPRYPPPTRFRAARWSSGLATSGAMAWRSTPGICRACAGPGPGRGPGCATPTSGSTAAPGSVPPSTATSCRSSRRRGSSCTTTSSGPCTPPCDAGPSPAQPSAARSVGGSGRSQ